MFTCEFCGKTFSDGHSCAVSLGEIPILRARVAELEAEVKKAARIIMAHDDRGRCIESLKEKLRHHYASGDYDRGHNCRATITLNALRQSLHL